METWLISVLTVATIEMILCLILPGLVIYMTLYKTPPEFKHFSLLLLIYSAVDAAGGFGGWMTFNQRVAGEFTENLSVFVSYGFCGFFGSYFCFFVEMMNFVPLMFNLTLTTFNMGYRLYLLHNKTPSFKKIAPILVLIAVLFISMAIHTLTCYASPDIILPYFSQEQVELYGNYTIFGQLFQDNWTVQLLDATMLYPFICCMIALIFRYFIIRSIKNMARAISNRSYKLQKEIIWVLTIQSCCPLLITISVIVFFSAVAVNLTHPVFQTLTYPIMVTTVITDAIVSLYFIAPYRRVINQWFKINQATTFKTSAAGPEEALNSSFDESFLDFQVDPAPVPPKIAKVEEIDFPDKRGQI